MSEALNVTKAAFGGLREVTTAPLWQYDYGQILQITGLDLPQAFEVHFSNSRKSGETVTQIGTNGAVTIPDMYLTSGADIYAFVFLHDGLTDGETEYVIKIPVRERPEPSDIEPTPEQQDVITEAIAVLNDAVEQTGEDKAATAALAEAAAASSLVATEAAQSAQGSATSASSSASTASTAAATATTKAGEAATSAANAASAKTAAETAETNARAAQTASESARASAESAAQTATTKAAEASTSATNASGSASAASASASQASESATQAAASATSASGSATAAAGSATTASTKASEASASATAAQTARAAAETAAATFETDTTLTVAGKAADAKATGDEVATIESELTDKKIASGNIVFGETVYGKYNNNGTYQSVGNWRTSYTDIIPCKEGDTFRYEGYADNQYANCPSALFYNKNGSVVSYNVGVRTPFGITTITIPSGVTGVRFQLAKTLTSGDVGERSVVALNPVSFTDVAKDVSEIMRDLTNSRRSLCYKSINLIDSIDFSEFEVGKVNVDDGSVTPYMDYVTGYIPIEPFVLYNKSHSGLCFCNEDKEYVGKSPVTGYYAYTNNASVKYAKYSFSLVDYYAGTVYLMKTSSYGKNNFTQQFGEITDDLTNAVTNGGLTKIAKSDAGRFVKGTNIFNLFESEWLYEKDLDSSGLPRNNRNHANGSLVVMFIPVEGGDTLVSNCTSWNYALYDVDKTFIGLYTSLAQSNEKNDVYTYYVPENIGAKFMSIVFKFSDDGTHGYDTDIPNGWIRSYAELNKLVIYKYTHNKLYPRDVTNDINKASYQFMGKFVRPNWNDVPDKDSEFFRMIRCEAIRAVNHTKHIYRIGNFNQYVDRGQRNWSIIKKMLSDYGIDICGFEEAQYAHSQKIEEKMSLGDYLRGWQFPYSSTFYPLGTTASPYSSRDMVSFFEVVEAEELPFPEDARYGQYNNRAALRTKIKLPKYLDCTLGQQYLGFYVIHPTVSATDLANLQKQEFQVCLDAMETDGCAFHIIAADSNAFNISADTHMPITWDWLVSKGFKLANDGSSKTVTGEAPDHLGSIDQFFVSSNINVVNFGVVNGYEYAYTENSNAGYVPISDHDFIYADVEFVYDDIINKQLPLGNIALVQNLTHVTSDTLDTGDIGTTYDQNNKLRLDNNLVVNLTTDSGYALSTVTVYVGGSNKTSSYYSDGVVSIPATTIMGGDVVITAIAEEE